MPNLHWITRKYFSHLSQHRINCGDCFNWAYVAYLNYDNAKLFTIDDFGGHAFVKIGGKYFDSESPRGISDWAYLKILPLMGDVRSMYPQQQTLEQFLRYWRTEGKSPLISLGG